MRKTNDGKVNRNALVEAGFLGKNHAMTPPLPRSVNSIKGLSPNSGMPDEKKLNRTKGKEKSRM